MEQLISVGTLSLLMGSPFEFIHNGEQTIYIKGEIIRNCLSITARVHVPGYFSWGYNRLPTDKAFNEVVRDTFLKVIRQMSVAGADTTELLHRVQVIWKSK